MFLILWRLTNNFIWLQTNINIYEYQYDWLLVLQEESMKYVHIALTPSLPNSLVHPYCLSLWENKIILLFSLPSQNLLYTTLHPSLQNTRSFYQNKLNRFYELYE